MSRPIIPILISYLLGLVAGYNLHIPFHITIFFLFISASLTALSILARRLLIIFLALSMLTMFILGIGRMDALLHPSLPGNHIANISSDEPLSLEGTIYEPPERGSDKVKLYIDLFRFYTGDIPHSIAGKLLLTVGEKDAGLRYGDRVRFLAKIKRPRNFHNPGGFDYEKYLALKGIFATAYLKNAEGIIRMGDGGPSFKGWIEKIRDSLRENLKRAGDSSPVLLSLITGEQGEIPKETREAFSKAGTAHILAISGEHIGIISLISFSILLFILKRSERVMLTVNIYKVAALATIPAIIIYSLIAGGGASIVRAAVMAGTVLAAVLFDRRKDVPSLISFAAFLILVFEPQALFDISFQLSFASVISLAMISPHFKGIFNDSTSHFVSWFAILVMVSLVATIGTAPLVAYYFNSISIISPVSNLITVPVVGFIIVPLGLASSILIPFSQSLSGWIIFINSTLINLIIKLNELFSSLPFSSIRVITPGIFEIVIFYLLIILLIYSKKSRLAGRLIIPATVFLLCMESFYFLSLRFQRDLRVTFLDVGQGESTLIEFPGGKRMLIDGGGPPGSDLDAGEMIIAPFLLHKRIRDIDYLVLSHPNSDHYGGLPFILGNFNIGEVWESGIEERSDGYAEFKRKVKEGDLTYKVVGDGENVAVNDVIIKVLNPPKGYVPEDDRGANNGSLLLKVIYGDVSFLFTGDIEKEAEYNLLSKGDELKSTILKVPHHGSLTSSTAEFLTRVRPEKAVFSIGYKNRFGFPKEAVLNRYKDIGADIYRTDSDGAISASTDGTSIKFFNSTIPQALSR